MKKQIVFFSVVVVMLGLSVGAMAEPKPTFISGTMDETSMIKVFGQDFGTPAADWLEKGTREDMVDLSSCVLIGDNPILENCSFREKMSLLKWTSSEINFRLSEENLAELEEFYFFIIDAEGNASWGVGPWMLGMGILNSSGGRIELEAMGDHLKPTGDSPGAVELKSFQGALGAPALLGG